MPVLGWLSRGHPEIARQLDDVYHFKGLMSQRFSTMFRDRYGVRLTRWLSKGASPS